MEEARRLVPSGKVVVHCWRGGQRSASVAWLLDKAGLEVTRLEGGYKSARKFIRGFLGGSNHQFHVLSGPTGSGKTEVLQALAGAGEYTLDLERLANHKGSSFGSLGEQPQPTTEQFENDLFAALLTVPRGARVWLEDESRMIGHVYLPDEFYNRLIAAPVVELHQPRQLRIQRLVRQYGGFPIESLAPAFTRLRKKLGGQHLQEALAALQVGDLPGAAAIALVYYDKAYAHYKKRGGRSDVRTLTMVSSEPNEIAMQLLLLISSPTT